jgi:PAS domain-containing protein
LPVLGGTVAGLLVFLLALYLTRISAIGRAAPHQDAQAMSGRLVFEGRCLIRGEGQVYHAFSDPSEGGDDWDRTVALLGADYPALTANQSPPSLPEGEIAGPGGRALVISQDTTETSLTLGHATPGTTVRAPADRDRVPDAIADGIPFPIWLRGADGTIEWVNSIYLGLATGHGQGRDDAWPPRDIFDAASLPDADAEDPCRRLPLLNGGPNAPAPVFDVYAHRTGAGTLFTAANADKAARAERNLREFTQTLTKTFAHLAIGLAIFDRSRRMILFNPALSELTGLSAASMTQKPTLSEFLDRLRERRIVPEPKDYASWRRKLTELEAAASSGTYEETWSLPNGQTYRVTGRPHPDGAIIFLFEDITAEISLTRRFRAELEIGQEVIDSFTEAIAVFSADGVFVMANAAYVALWDHDPEREMTVATVSDATAHWHARTVPTPIWGDLRDFVRHGRNRVEWSADIILADGRPLVARFVPLSGGGTVVTFRHLRSGDTGSTDEAEAARRTA